MGYHVFLKVSFQSVLRIQLFMGSFKTLLVYILFVQELRVNYFGIEDLECKREIWRIYMFFVLILHKNLLADDGLARINISKIKNRRLC